MNLPTNAIALLGNEYARKCCRRGMSNLQKITCIILRNLFGLDLFSHQSCATGTLLLQKMIYPRKSSLNLKQLIFFMFLTIDQLVIDQINNQKIYHSEMKR